MAGPNVRPRVCLAVAAVVSALALSGAIAAPSSAAPPGSAPAAPAPAAPAASPATPTPEQRAAEALAETRRAYAAVKSFTDQGTVQRTIVKGTGERAPAPRRFTLAFARPDRWRFEYAPPEQGAAPGAGGGAASASAREHHAVWQDDSGSARLWRTAQPMGQPRSTLAAALAEGGGLSQGVLPLYARLLLPDQVSTPSLLERLNDAKSEREETVQGHRCTVVTGQSARGPVTLWLCSTTRLIRQMEIRSDVAVTTFTFNPQINPTLGPSAFRFQPPESDAAAPAEVPKPSGK